MIRMRHHRDSSGQVRTRPEANEIILINSHDSAFSACLAAAASMPRSICARPYLARSRASLSDSSGQRPRTFSLDRPLSL